MDADADGPGHIGPVAELPFIDEHTRFVPAPVDTAWNALVARLAARDSPTTNAYARLVGADPRRCAGEFPGVVRPCRASRSVRPDLPTCWL